VQVEVKKAEPRDMKMVADYHFDSSSPVIECTTDETGAAAAAAAVAAANMADNDGVVVSASAAGRISSSCPLIVLHILAATIRYEMLF